MAKKEIIFETDDLVFDPKFIQATDLYKNKMNAAEKLQYQKGVGEEIIKTLSNVILSGSQAICITQYARNRDGCFSHRQESC